ncbi:hypothetical protein ABZ357_06165 [Streptomyces sp. NPDC005917]|uniref:hypothetical protein n=1 Tax=unclassified Streptomyces TaxID=2593676 RepID=UPI0033D37AD4
MAVSGLELQFRLMQHWCFHCGSSHSPSANPFTLGFGAGSCGTPDAFADGGVAVELQELAESDALIAAPEQGVLALEIVGPGAHELVDGIVAFQPLDLLDVLGVVQGVALAVDGEVVGGVDLQEPLFAPAAEVQAGSVRPGRWARSAP